MKVVKKKLRRKEKSKAMEEELRNRWLKCIECGHEFPFEVGEQKYYKDKGLLIPRRCPSCRAERKTRREATK